MDEEEIAQLKRESKAKLEKKLRTSQVPEITSKEKKEAVLAEHSRFEESLVKFYQDLEQRTYEAKTKIKGVDIFDTYLELQKAIRQTQANLEEFIPEARIAMIYMALDIESTQKFLENPEEIATRRTDQLVAVSEAYETIGACVSQAYKSAIPILSRLIEMTGKNAGEFHNLMRSYQIWQHNIENQYERLSKLRAKELADIDLD